MRVAVITSSDMVAGVPMGGTSGFLQSVLPYFRSEAAVFGFRLVDGRSGDDLIPGTLTDFRAVFRARYPTRVPHRLKALLGYAMHGSEVYRYRPDILYIHSPEIALPFLVPSPSVPVVFHQHGSTNPVARSSNRWARRAPFRKVFHEIYGLICRRADWVVGIDRYCVEEARARGAEGKVSMVMNAVDTHRFRPMEPSRTETRAQMGLGETQHLMLFVGRLESVKRVDCAIGALRLLNSRGGGAFRLAVAGEGSQRPILEKQVRASGLQQQVTFLGQLSGSELVGLYNAADCLVLPSEAEGVPMTILEALACGTPVVATRVGGVPELLVSDLAGSLIERPDPAELSRAVAEVVARPRVRSEVANTVQRFDARTVALELEDLFARILNSKRLVDAGSGLPGGVAE